VSFCVVFWPAAWLVFFAMPLAPQWTRPYPPPSKAKERPPAESDSLVREIVDQQFSCARCLFRPASVGGRVLVVTRRVLRGEVVGRAFPQMISGPASTSEQKVLREKINHFFESETEDDEIEDVVWGALHCLVAEDLPAGGFPLAAISEALQGRLFLSSMPNEFSPSDPLLRLHQALGLCCPPLKLEKMVQVWRLNCFTHMNRRNTAVISLGTALMNHSCLPSVNWYFEGDEMVLRANADLEVGAELTVSYLEDQHLHKPTRARKEYIEDNFCFTCTCVRCSDPHERCRHVFCPDEGCLGSISLSREHEEGTTSPRPCGTCGQTLTAEEWAARDGRESELERLLNHLKSDDSEDEGDDKDEKAELEEEEANNCEGEGEEAKDRINFWREAFDVDKVSLEELEWVRQTVASGRFLAPAGHWLAHRAHGLLLEEAKARQAGPAEILAHLDHRAAFVRQAYKIAEPMPPPCPEHGWELLEAAELLLGDGWPAEEELAATCKRVAAAQARLQESIGVLEPMFGPKDAAALKARQLLLSLRAGEGASAVAQEPCADGSGVDLKVSPEKTVDWRRLKRHRSS